MVSTLLHGPYSHQDAIFSSEVMTITCNDAAVPNMHLLIYMLTPSQSSKNQMSNMFLSRVSCVLSEITDKFLWEQSYEISFDHLGFMQIQHIGLHHVYCFI